MTANEKVFALNCISTSRNGCLYSITEDPDGNVWACGEMHDGLWIRPSIVVMDKNTKKTSVGKQILILGNGCLHSITDGSDGNIWACGGIYEHLFYNPFFIAVDKNTKEMVIQKHILTSSEGCLRSITEGPDGNMWACGFINNGSYDEPFFIVINKDTKEIVTQKCILTSGNGQLYSISEGPDGNVWACGFVYNGSCNKPFFVVIDKNTKEVIMQKHILTSNHGYLHSIIDGSDGNIWACGKIHNGYCDRPFIIAIDKNTKEIPMQRYILTPRYGELHFITKDFNNNIWAYGHIHDGLYWTPFILFINKDTDTKEAFVQEYIFTSGNGCLYSAIFPTKNTGSSMWMCGGTYVDLHEKPFIVDIDLTNMLDTCSLVREVDFEVKETNHTTEDAFYPVVDTDYSIKPTSYAIEILKYHRNSRRKIIK